MICENCGKECDELIWKTGFNNNKDNRKMCSDCFSKEHPEEMELING